MATRISQYFAIYNVAIEMCPKRRDEILYIMFVYLSTENIYFRTHYVNLITIHIIYISEASIEHPANVCQPKPSSLGSCILSW